ncbi:cofilin, partial [Claviceps pusilla]
MVKSANSPVFDLPFVTDRQKLTSPASSRATVSQECIEAYNDLKLSKKYKYIIFKLSDDFKQIVIEDASTDKDWENFREKLINSTTKSKSGVVGKGCRYAVYDFEYNLASGDGVR